MKTKRIGIGFIGLLCTAVFIMTTSSVSALEGEEVKIGALIPLTGFASGFGGNQKIALDLAIKEINAAGGIGGKKLNVILYDTESKGETSILGFRKLATQDEVLAILGPFLSTECEVSFPLANRYKVVSISASAAKPGLAASNRPYGFTNSTTDMDIMPPAVKKWQAKYNIKKVCIVTDIKDALNKNTGEVVFPGICKQLGIEIIGTASYVTGEMDFSATITKFKGLNPHGVMISGTLADAAGIVKEAAKQAMRKPFIGGVAIQAPKFLELAGRDAEGTYTGASFFTGNPLPKSKAFVESYVKASGGPEPNPFAANMHENLFIMKELIEKTGVTNKKSDLPSDREKIMKGLTALKNFSGVTGTFSMKPEGTVEKTGYVLVVKDGKWTIAD